ncbi:MAG TPA: DUF2339 domain-containing protein [Thermoanaerobaculia bacterium]|jgi:hypothetical protein|nr:DUF2339 domain-containing protein [Thermoanaerobaculia bacterium]
MELVALVLVVILVSFLLGDEASAMAEVGGGQRLGPTRAAVLLGLGAATACSLVLRPPGFHHAWASDWRLGAGVAAAAVLVGSGAALERRIGWVGQGFIGAGLALLLPCLCLAAELGFLSRPIAFGAIGLTVAAALVTALRTGPAVALMGLVVGLLAPYWRDWEAGAPMGGRDRLPLFYLLLLFGALLAAKRSIPTWLGCGVAFACARGAVGGQAFALGGGSAMAWWLTGLTSAALLALARRAPSRATLGWVWVAAGAAAGLADGAWMPPGAKVSALGMAVTAGFVVASGLAVFSTEMAARWPAAVAGVSTAYFLVGLPAEQQGLGAAWVALGLAALNLALVVLASRVSGREEARAALAAPLTATLGFLCAALPLALGKGLFEVGGALLATALVWAAARFGLRELRPAAAVAALGAVVAAAWDLPGFLELQGPAAREVQLYGYGLPLLLFAAAAAATLRRGPRPLAWVLAWSATALVALVVRLMTSLTTPYLEALFLLVLVWPLPAWWIARLRARPQVVP